MKFTIRLLCIFPLILLMVAGSIGEDEGNALVVIDTDGGVDDAEAVLLALTNQNIARVLAITCVFGNTDVNSACKNALREVVLADSQGIPVHKGSKGSLKTGKYVPELAYYIGLDGLGNRSQEFPTGEQRLTGVPAAVALTRLARSNPRNVTLLAIGPMTNLALAHRIDPHFTHFLKEIVILGGNYNGSVTSNPEFNFKSDPLAANIILTEAACPLTLVPFETCKKNGIPWGRYKQLAQIDTKLGHFFQRVTEVETQREFQRGDPTFFIYDFLAAAVVFYPESVKSHELRTLEVEDEGRLTKGLVVVVPQRNERRQVRIVTELNATLIDQLFYRLLTSF